MNALIKNFEQFFLKKFVLFLWIKANNFCFKYINPKNVFKQNIESFCIKLDNHH